MARDPPFYVRLIYDTSRSAMPLKIIRNETKKFEMLRPVISCNEIIENGSFEQGIIENITI